MGNLKTNYPEDSSQKKRKYTFLKSPSKSRSSTVNIMHVAQIEYPNHIKSYMLTNM